MSSLPPPLHSYQRSSRRAQQHSNVKSQQPPTASPSSDDESPSQRLYKAILQKKEEQYAKTSLPPSPTTMSLLSPPLPAPPAFEALIPDFPALQPTPIHHCMIHAPTAAPLMHPMARPSYCAVSNTCTLPRASFWNVRCSCIFSALPDELLLFNVFSFLQAPEICKLSAVSSRWKFLSTDPILWREVDLSKHAQVIDSQVFNSIMSRVGDHVHQLKLCNLKFVGHDALVRLGQSHLSRNASLKALHLCSIKIVDMSILSSILLSPAGGSLRELSLFGCANVDDDCIRLIRRTCVKLADLSVRGCLKITDAAFMDQDENEIIPAAADDKIEMLIDTIPDHGMDLNDRSRSSSAASITSVSSLSSYPSSSSSSYYDGGLPSVSGRFAYLTSLNVANCKLLTESGLIAIFQSSPLLQKLNLHGLNPTDNMIDIMTTYCPQLHTLHLSSANAFGGNFQFTDVGMEYIAARLPNLQCLNLQGSSKLTDACMVPLMTRCIRLEKLNLGGCFKLTDHSLAAIASTPRPSRLTHLSLFQCVHITDAGVILLADRLTELQHLDVHSCASLTDATLQHFMTPIVPVIPTLEPIEHSLFTGLDEDQPLSESDSIPSTPTLTPTPTSPLSPAHSNYPIPTLLSLDIGSCRKMTPTMVAQFKQIRTQVDVTHY